MKFYPYGKWRERGGGGKCLSHAEEGGGGHNTFWGSINMGA